MKIRGWNILKRFSRDHGVVCGRLRYFLGDLNQTIAPFQMFGQRRAPAITGDEPCQVVVVQFRRIEQFCIMQIDGADGQGILDGGGAGLMIADVDHKCLGSGSGRLCHRLRLIP